MMMNNTTMSEVNFGKNEYKFKKERVRDNIEEVFGNDGIWKWILPIRGKFYENMEMNGIIPSKM
jgi:hypothetical protein